MPAPGQGLPYSPPEQETLLNQLLVRVRNKTITAVAGVFDRLNVSGDINARNMIVTGNETVRGSQTVTGPLINSTKYKARLKLAAAGQALGTGTQTQIAFDTIDFDPNGNCTTGASAHYSCPVAGYYGLSGLVYFTTSATTNVAQCVIFINGTQAISGTAITIAWGGQGALLDINEAVFKLGLGDIVDLRFFQNSGSTWNVGSSGSNHCHLAIHYLSS